MDIKILPKKILILVLVLLIVILVVGIWLGVKLLTSQNPESPSEYSAVFLKTGDVYFGKLSFFPWPKMKNVWFLQKSVDAQNQMQLGIFPLRNLFWGPIDKIYLNPSEIVFWTSLRKNSQLVEALRNPNILQPAQSQNLNQQQPNQTTTPTSNATSSR